MEQENQQMYVELDAETGYTTCIRSKEDAYAMNWVLEASDFGRVDGFQVQKINAAEKGLTVDAAFERRSIALRIEKKLTETGYVERYVFTNNGAVEWFVNKDSFGIHLPFATRIEKNQDFQQKICTAHVWCGEDICWVCAPKLSGDAPCLVMNMTEGSIADYSISRDRSRERVGASYRGDIVLNPAPRVVKPGANAVYVFEYRFTDGDPIDALKAFPGFVHLSADRYTAQVGEYIRFSAYCPDGFEKVTALCGEKEFPVEVKVEGCNAVWTAAFDELGEKKITVCANGKKTCMVVNVIQSLETILKNRARFIARKQQYHDPGSCLDGAYLCYDQDTASLYYDHTCCWPDHNAGRERIAMGITVLKQLQQEPDEELLASISKHRAFVERELLDEQYTVYGEVKRDGSWLREYNFPWMAIYFFAWYQLTGEKRDLETAAKILLRYYECAGAKQEAQGIEACRTLAALKAEGMDALAEQLQTAFLSHVDNIYQRDFVSDSKEVGWVSEMPNCMAMYLLQGYLLTGQRKYLEKAEIYITASKTFYGLQPDYHLNMVDARHWDRYWFGRHAEYGDIFPHHWSVLTAEMFWWYEKATGVDCRKEIDTILGANLCLYRPNGFAANNYLYAYKTEVFASGNVPAYAGLGVFYGKRYDERANDQDWILYYATVLK